MSDKDQSRADEIHEQFISGLSEILIQLKKDLYMAQHELDVHADETQKEILRSRMLTEYGITSQYYSMPEIELEVKMEYSSHEEKTIVDGKETIIMKTRLIPSGILTEKNKEGVVRVHTS